MLPTARMGDIVIGTCTCHKSPINTIGHIISSCGTVMVNGLPVGRLGDMVLTECGHVGYIISGSSTVLAVGIPMARMTDITTGCFIGTVAQGSNNVLCK